MKRNIFIIIVVFMLTYLMFAFVNVTFDFTLWDSTVRTFYLLVSLFFCAMYLTYPKL